MYNKNSSYKERVTCLTSSVRQWEAGQKKTPGKDKVRYLIPESPSDWWEYDAQQSSAEQDAG